MSSKDASVKKKIHPGVIVILFILAVAVAIVAGAIINSVNSRLAYEETEVDNRGFASGIVEGTVDNFEIHGFADPAALIKLDGDSHRYACSDEVCLTALKIGDEVRLSCTQDPPGSYPICNLLHKIRKLDN